MISNSPFFRLLFFICLLLGHNSISADKPLTLQSPDKNINVTITFGDKLSYAVTVKGQEVLPATSISMTLSDSKVLGVKPKLTSQKANSVNTEVKPLYGLNASIKDNFNELTLNFKEYSVAFRAYNDGVAYRFITNLNGEITVKSEEAPVKLKDDYSLYYLSRDNDYHGYEENYKYSKILEIKSSEIICLPYVVRVPGGPVVAVTESDLFDYPALYYKKDQQGLKAEFPAYPLKSQPGGYNNYNRNVTERADYIAKTQGKRSFPWRVLAFLNEDKDLLRNNLVYLLASNSRITNTSWIKPGKVAWDWWSDNNLTGVDFETGWNTATFKYYIDFAAKNGLEYVNVDEGWSELDDVLKVKEVINIPELAAYAKEKNVKLILWVAGFVLEQKLEEAMEQFQKWGIAGIKVDFIDRDDQVGINFYEKIASAAAKRNILVNFHGATKPTGFDRAYPNVVNREGVLGLEFNKWSDKANNDHNVTIPFIRMFAGYMDYTPGALYNAGTKKNFRSVFSRPMSQGTRCHQLAMFVVYYAPLQMLSDSPTAYEKEKECLDFISKVPTTWDESQALDGRISDYLAVARRKGDSWFVGAMADSVGKEMKLKLSFLGEGEYTAEIFQDGINANKNGVDFKRIEKAVKKDEEIAIKMTPGGGWVARISKKK